MVLIKYLSTMSLPKLGKFCTIAGLVFLVSGLFMAIVVPKIIEVKITEQTRLVNNSETFNKWKNPSLPIFIRFYVFNVTNPQSVIIGQDPIFQEVGPIVYEERRTKEVDDIDTEKDTVTFRQSITYNFRPDLSTLTECDEVTTLNIPLVGLSKLGMSMTLSAGVARDTLHDYMDSNPGQVTVLIRRTVKELLFEGYYDGLLEEMAKLAGTPIFPKHTFGLYVGKNGTFGLPLKIDAGVQNFNNFGKVVEFNGYVEMDQWNDEYCNRLNGSDGSLFAPFVRKDRTLRIFSEEGCRSVYMTFQKEVDYFGVPAYRFHLPPTIWASAKLNEDNRCFCHGNRGNCERSGLMDISPCKKGAPVFGSMPHFLYGDADLWSRSGIQPPSSDRDETYLDLEPTTGMLVGAMKRFQINIDLVPSSKVRGFRYLPRMIFPILWGEEFFISSEAYAAMLNDKLLRPINLVRTLYCLQFTLGSILTTVGLVLLILHRNRGTDQIKPGKS